MLSIVEQAVAKSMIVAEDTAGMLPYTEGIELLIPTLSSVASISLIEIAE
jgi:hypothetical protein